jgi:hypothetical protein
MNRKKFILIFSSLLIFLIQVSSQVPFVGKEIGSEFNRGMELFNKEKYPAAIRLLDSYTKSEDNKNLISVSDAEYYSAVASLKLFNSDAEYRMIRYISSHPEITEKLLPTMKALTDRNLKGTNLLNIFSGTATRFISGAIRVKPCSCSPRSKILIPNILRRQFIISPRLPTNKKCIRLQWRVLCV